MRLDDSEASVLSGCLSLLEFRGIFAYRSKAEGVRVGKGMVRMLPSGCPDITAILPRMKDGRTGIYCGIETKSPVSIRNPNGGRIRKSQIRFAEMVEKSGGIWLFVYDIGALSDWIEDNVIL
jgi:hypothetical protein